ncbi:MAG: TIGR00296 family protein [Thermoplasmata archaeon]|nr:MAG: TIGR00296 family protein [Thermoplasmata archaeon]
MAFNIMNIEEGEKLVRYARKVIENHVSGFNTEDLENFEEKRGVFVTINTYPERMLRGCIGIPEPIMPLRKAIKEAAVSACHDPRFPDLRKEETDSIVIEVTILTPPELIESKPEEYVKHIKVGRDGLIVEHGYYRGLLLPQVPVEYNWDVETFLQHTCMKAGLPADAWKDGRTRLYKFQGEIFAEEEPRGRIIKVEMDG